MVDARLNVPFISLLPGITAEQAGPADRRTGSSLSHLGKAIFAAKSAVVSS